MMDRVSKLLNQAERAPEGSPEREAFMEKALVLSQAHSIDIALARSHTAKKERVEQPERRSFKVAQQGLTANKNAHFVDLMLAICEANDIECLISGSNVYVHGHGMPSDMDLAERLFSLLSVQMVSEADAGLKRGDNGEWVEDAIKTQRVEIPEAERAWGEHDGGTARSDSCYYDDRDEELIEDGKGGWLRNRYVVRGNAWEGEYEWVKSYPPPKFKTVPVTDENGEPVRERKWVSMEDARVWRANFYQGFISRARSRLRQAKKQAMLDAGIDYDDKSDSRTMALRDKEKEVKDFAHQYLVLATGSYSGAQVSSYAHGGQMAGDAAGQRAVLGNEKDLK